MRSVTEWGRKGQFKEMSCFPFFTSLLFHTLDGIFLFEPLCPWRASKSINLSQLSIYNRGPHFLAQWYPEACQRSLVTHPVSRLEGETILKWILKNIGLTQHHQQSRVWVQWTRWCSLVSEPDPGKAWDYQKIR